MNRFVSDKMDCGEKLILTMKKTMLIIICAFLFVTLLFSCTKNADCEAFEIMSSGNFTLTLSLDLYEEHTQIIYSQHNDAVALCEINSGDSQFDHEYLFTQDGGYDLDYNRKTFSSYYSADLANYEFLHFDKKQYTFKEKVAIEGGVAYVYKRGKNALTFIYENGELSEIQYTPYVGGKLNKDYAFTIQVLKIENEYNRDLLYSIPSDYSYIEEN